MAGKRHHFLPRVLLRRFAETSGKREGLVWRVDKKTGQPRAVAPKYEAALPNYYRLEWPDGSKDARAEDLLARIEDAAAAAIRRVGRGDPLSDEERAWLAVFVAVQHRRTPPAREWLNFFDQLLARWMTEVSLGNAEKFHRRTRQVEPDMRPEQIEQVRIELLEDLQSGRLMLGSTPSREVASMFLSLDHVAEDLVANFSWAVLRAPAGVELMLPDMGITMHDPTPPHPDSGLGFRSSPNTETVLPVDPTFAIALAPGAPEWHDEDVDEAAIEEINLRAYAWSEAAFYGRSQKVVTDLRAAARRQTARLGQFRPRSGRMWVTEVEGGPKTGELEFTGHSPEGQSRARFVVDPRAFDDVKFRR